MHTYLYFLVVALKRPCGHGNLLLVRLNGRGGDADILVTTVHRQRRDMHLCVALVDMDSWHTHRPVLEHGLGRIAPATDRGGSISMPGRRLYQMRDETNSSPLFRSRLVQRLRSPLSRGFKSIAPATKSGEMHQGKVYERKTVSDEVRWPTHSLI